MSTFQFSLFFTSKVRQSNNNYCYHASKKHTQSKCYYRCLCHIVFSWYSIQDRIAILIASDLFSFLLSQSRISASFLLSKSKVIILWLRIYLFRYFSGFFNSSFIVRFLTTVYCVPPHFVVPIFSLRFGFRAICITHIITPYSNGNSPLSSASKFSLSLPAGATFCAACVVGLLTLFSIPKNAFATFTM